MIWAGRSRRRTITLAALVGLFLIGFSLAARRGPRPAPGAVYRGTVIVQTASGHVLARVAIVIPIDAAGRRALTPQLDALPSACDPRRLARVRIGAGSAPIRTPSRFLLALPLRRETRLGRDGGGAPTSTAVRLDTVGELLVGGSFETLGRLSGAVVTHFRAAGLRGCGASGGYTARSG